MSLREIPSHFEYTDNFLNFLSSTSISFWPKVKFCTCSSVREVPLPLFSGYLLVLSSLPFYHHLWIILTWCLVPLLDCEWRKLGSGTLIFGHWCLKVTNTMAVSFSRFLSFASLVSLIGLEMIVLTSLLQLAPTESI